MASDKTWHFLLCDKNSPSTTAVLSYFIVVLDFSCKTAIYQWTFLLECKKSQFLSTNSIAEQISFVVSLSLLLCDKFCSIIDYLVQFSVVVTHNSNVLFSTFYEFDFPTPPSNFTVDRQSVFLTLQHWITLTLSVLDDLYLTFVHSIRWMKKEQRRRPLLVLSSSQCRYLNKLHSLLIILSSFS